MTTVTGEVRMFAGNFAPAGWMLCDGGMLPIKDYGDLYDVIRTTYGGNGTDSFALPDLRVRAPMHRAAHAPIGRAGGNGAVAAPTDPQARAQQFLPISFIIAYEGERPKADPYWHGSYGDMNEPYIGEIRMFGCSFA